MSDDDSSRRRGRRQVAASSDEEEEDTGSARRGRRQASEEEEAPSRNGRQQASESEEEEEVAPTRRGGRAERANPGETFQKIPEAKRKKMQKEITDGMFKHAEKKYGRKRPVKAGEKHDVMEDYNLYLRSVKAKVKAATDKLNTVLKQKKDIDAKVATAEREQNSQQDKLTKAENEKENAINDGRDPVMPKDFIVPQRAKKASAGLGALVMEASANMWEDKFSQMRSKKTTSKTPEWMAKQKKSDKTSALLKVGKKERKDKKSAEAPKFSTNLKSSGAGARRRKEEEEKPNPFKINLKKTGSALITEDDQKSKQKASIKKPAPEPEVEEEDEEEEEDSRPKRRGRQRADDSD